MQADKLTQWPIAKVVPDDYLLTWIEAFLIDRKAQNLSTGTLYTYRAKLKLFVQYCESQVITQIHQITPVVIREYLFWLAENHHNEGGIHACYRTLKTFLRWFWAEYELDTKNPIAKVKPPKLAQEPLNPVSLGDIDKLLSTCGKNYNGVRDRSILLTLLDSGTRAAELLALDIGDLNQVSGALLIRYGKGRKSRTVFVGRLTRRALRAWLKVRGVEPGGLFVTEGGSRLTYDGLRSMVVRRAKKAGIEPPQLHAFRRAFAINMLRAGVDIYSLQALMGHADLQVLRRYLKQTDGDLQEAHAKGSPVDRRLK